MTNLKDIASKTADHLGGTKGATEDTLRAAFAVIKSELAAGNEVSIPDFGKFEVKQSAERQGRNPATGASITIAASRSAKFKPAKALKDAL